MGNVLVSPISLPSFIFKFKGLTWLLNKLSKLSETHKAFVCACLGDCHYIAMVTRCQVHQEMKKKNVHPVWARPPLSYLFKYLPFLYNQIKKQQQGKSRHVYIKSAVNTKAWVRLLCFQQRTIQQPVSDI